MVTLFLVQASWPAFAGVVHTLSVDTVNLPPGGGTYRVDVDVDKPTPIIIKVELNGHEDAAGVAGKIADAINADTADDLGGSSTASGDTVFVKFVAGTTYITKDGLSVSPGTVLKSASANIPAGYLNFFANPDTGLAMLAHNETVTAGFFGGTGLSSVSYVATAGSTLAQLDSQLSSALSGAGYNTSITSNGVLVYGDGAGDANLLKIGMTTTGLTDSTGLDLSAQAVPEPEPWMLGALAGASGFAYAWFRGRGKRRAVSVGE
jgi:hypothetical protein